jgi:hypothetical protein
MFRLYKTANNILMAALYCSNVQLLWTCYNNELCIDGLNLIVPYHNT